MAAHRPRGRFAVAAALFLVGTMLPPDGVAGAAGPTLDVTREITVTADERAVLSATTAETRSSPTIINVEVLPSPPGQSPQPADNDGDTPASPDGQCTIATGERQCTLTLISKRASINDVRVWIDDEEPDTSEGRLAKKTVLLGIGGDCVGDEASLLGDTECEQGGEAPGSTAEPDATDVVRVQWLNFAEGRLNCDDGDPADGADVAYNDAAAGDRAETYACRLTTVAGIPIQGAFIDGEVVEGTGQDRSPDTADFPDLCKTDGNGRCATAPIEMPVDGASTICFWGEPASQNDPAKGADNNFRSPGADTDGGGCNAEPVDERENNEMSDAVYLDTGLPRAEGLDVTPETTTVAGGSRFSLHGSVFDQFGRPYHGDTTVRAKLFEGSVLAGGGDNNVASLDPNLKCATNGSPSCTILTAAQNDLGQNLACVWIEGKAPTAMIGQADQDSATCTAPKAPWQSRADQEARLDATNDDGAPFPSSDGLDVVRFAVQSRPTIVTVTPPARRQDVTGDLMAIDGMNFLPSALMTISGTGVTLGPTVVVSDRRLEASLAVAPDAPPGPRDVTVTNRSDGGTVTCAGCFRVIGQGYWLVASDGGVFAFGDTTFAGSPGGQPLNQPIVAMAPTPSGLGYWLVATDGGIFNYGDALFHGSTGGIKLGHPIVGIAPTRSGQGYWLVAADGSIYNYGDALFYGTTSGIKLKYPIVGIAPTRSGQGYWLVAADGGIFAFGDAGYFGSTGGIKLNHSIVGIAPTRSGQGYWLIAADGGVFSFGDATFYGSTGDAPLNRPIVGMTTTPSGEGYWMVASDGGIFAFGDAGFFGSTGDVPLNQPIVGLAPR